MQEALFDLADAGGWMRTEAALEALNEVMSDRAKLGEAALKALARGEAIGTAGSMVSRYVGVSHGDLLPASMPALIYLASPRCRSLLDDPGFPGEPEPLLAVYRLFPVVVHGGIRLGLRQPDKRSCIEVGNAVAAIINVDPDFGPRVAGALIGSLGLPDDHYDEGSAEGVVVRTLAIAMKVRPATMNGIVQEALAVASDSAREALFRVYVCVLQRDWNESHREVTQAIS